MIFNIALYFPHRKVTPSYQSTATVMILSEAVLGSEQSAPHKCIYFSNYIYVLCIHTFGTLYLEFFGYYEKTRYFKKNQVFHNSNFKGFVINWT